METKIKGNWPGKPRKEYKAIDISKVEKCNDPYKPGRVVTLHKYEAMFYGVKEGDCFRVPGGNKEVSAVALALRHYLKRHQINGIVRQKSVCDDGIGRVWLIKVLP
jgi:hypothetical protein